MAESSLAVGSATPRAAGSPRAGTGGVGARGAGLAGLGAAACGLVALLLPTGQVRLALLLVFACVGPGAAIVTHVRVRESYLLLPLILLGSLTLSALVPTVMLLASWWHPTAELGVLAAACAVSAGLGLIRRRP